MKTKKMTGMGACLAAALLALTACGEPERTWSGLNRSDFQTVVDGQPTDLYVLRGRGGMEVCVTNYGARVVSVWVPDAKGRYADVVCAFDSIGRYLAVRQNFGATIGRYIGRIRDARFTLDGVEHRLMANKDTHCAHGGEPGFASRIWQAERLSRESVRMTYLSPDGENGFPGNLRVSLTYTVTPDGGLDLRYEAQTDRPTVLNLSHHSFFNISGQMDTSVEDQRLYVCADAFTPYDSLRCVTGEIRPVDGTPMDLRTPVRIGDHIDDDDPQLRLTGGYDHTWMLGTGGDDTRLAASVDDPVSGRRLEVYTTEPAIQVYTANGLKGKMKGKGGIAYPRRAAICLETMHPQDAPNQPNFPSTVLRPGETYTSHTLYRFTTTTATPTAVSARR